MFKRFKNVDVGTRKVLPTKSGTKSGTYMTSLSEESLFLRKRFQNPRKLLFHIDATQEQFALFKRFKMIREVDILFLCNHS